METKIFKPNALIVDDERSICEALSGVLGDENWSTSVAYSGFDAIEAYKKGKFDLVLLDIWMDGLDGIETLQKLRDLDTKVPIVIMSGHGTIETAVKVTKLGAFNFLEKPLSITKLLPILEYAKALAISEQDKLDSALDGHIQLLGKSEATARIRRQIRMLAPRGSWVLITGENGTGKEVVARNLHLFSLRSEKPFVPVNCAAIPEELIESELFGHTKGAFTSAIGSKKGRFEQAHQGTLFLDEIGDMSLKTQAKILRLLQEQTFERLGSNETISVDVRVIAATNKNLREEIAAGRFREDLFYRLNVIPMHMRPLRERIDDIPVLAEHFLAEMAKELSEPRKSITKEAMNLLIEYPWPGNVRELKNLMERLAVLSSAVEISEADMRDHLLSNDEAEFSDATKGTKEGNLKEARNEFEKRFILEKLKENEFNVSKTADLIGLERSHLYRKMRFYELDRDD